MSGLTKMSIVGIALGTRLGAAQNDVHAVAGGLPDIESVTSNCVMFGDVVKHQDVDLAIDGGIPGWIMLILRSRNHLDVQSFNGLIIGLMLERSVGSVCCVSDDVIEAQLCVVILRLSKQRSVLKVLDTQE